MKRVITLIACIFIISTISAVTLESEKTTLNQGENFLAVLNGNFLEEIDETQIGFYIDHLEQPFDFGLKKISGKYYIYSITPYVSGNYTLRVEDIYVKENNLAQTLDKELPFSVSNNLADFYVSPGTLNVRENFTLTFYNNLNNDLQITYNLENKSSSFNLPLQQERDIFIKTDNIQNTTFTNLEISSDQGHSYTLPIYITKPFSNNTVEENNTETENNESTFDEIDRLEFLADEIKIEISPDQLAIHPFSLKNIGEKKAENISLRVSDDLKAFVYLSEEEIDLLEVNDELNLNFTFEFPETGIFEGEIIAESENSTDSILLSFKVEKDTSFNTSNPPPKTCSDLGYQKCAVCYGATPIAASDGLCCPGSCEPVEEPVSRNYTAIIIIVCLVLIIGIFIFLRMKKPKKTAKDILKSRQEKFSKSTETTNSLSNI